MTAVVTGGAQGIGAAIGDRLLGAGRDVLLVDRNPAVAATAARLTALHGRAAAALAVDIAADDAPARVLDALAGSRVDALINNAGVTRDALVEKMTDDDFRLVLRVNLGGAYRLTSELLDVLEVGAAVVNVSSKSANGNIGQFNYAASKAGLVGLTRSLALQLAPRVRVNAVAPAFTVTEMTDAIPPDVRERIVAGIPFGRGAEPSEIADVVAWLASPAASYVTGQVVAACGGRSFG